MSSVEGRGDRDKEKDMKKQVTLLTFCAALLALCPFGHAQQSKVYHVGIIHQGGPYKVVVDGLQDGLRELGYETGKQIRLEIRDTKSNTKLVDEAAKQLERDKVNLIYAVTTSVATAVTQVTSSTPIVFAVGSDLSLVDSCRFREARRETYRRSVLDDGPHRKTARAVERNHSKTESRVDRLQPRQPHVQRGRRFGA